MMIEGLIILGVVILIAYGLDRWVTWYWKKIGFPGYGPVIRELIDRGKK